LRSDGIVLVARQLGQNLRVRRLLRELIPRRQLLLAAGDLRQKLLRLFRIPPQVGIGRLLLQLSQLRTPLSQVKDGL